MSDTSSAPYPLHTFNFVLEFAATPLGGLAPAGLQPDGAFSECTGLEMTMEPKVIKEGGRNFGPNQRAGQVTFGTVVLKRGITRNGDLFAWFKRVASGGYAYRMQVTIRLQTTDKQPALAWKLQNAMPVKFKAGDLNAKATEVGIEELHLAHEGLSLEVSG